MQNNTKNLYFIRQLSAFAILHCATPCAAKFCSDAFAARRDAKHATGIHGWCDPSFSSDYYASQSALSIFIISKKRKIILGLFMEKM